MVLSTGQNDQMMKIWLGCQALWEVVNASYSACGLHKSGSHQDVSRDLPSLMCSPIIRRRMRNTSSWSFQTLPKVRGWPIHWRAGLLLRAGTWHSTRPCRVLFLKRTNPSDGTGWELIDWTARLGGLWQWWGCMNTNMTNKSRQVTIQFTQHLLCHTGNTVSSFGVPL